MRLRPLLLASALLVLAAPLANAARMTPALRGDLLTLPAAQRYVAFASFAPTVTPQQRLAIAQQHGLHVVHDFAPNARSLFLSGTVGQFQALALEAEVSFMEENTRIPLLDATHGWPTRVRVAHEPVSGGPYYDAQGRTLRGQGVGAAIVDSGVNGLQGDFDDNMVRNFKVTCNILGAEVDSDTCVFTDVGVNGTSDSTGGHGTHVAGITLGGGQRSDIGYPASAMPAIPGTYSGIAPDAGLYAFGSGETLFVLNYTAAASFDWIIKNNPTLEVPVRVINNSYGGAGPYEADAVVSQLTLTAVQNNISVIFAAGNDAGGGAADSQTSSYCRDPNPGVVCVASYNDAGTGTQKGLLSSFTSKGKLGEHGDYPDIAAPGDTITSACTQVQPGQAVCATGAETTWQPFYGTISGTSMAAPHVAGALALIYQARPELTPAQAEKLLKDTAIKVATNGEYETDPSNPGGTHNFGFGAGLMDLPAALDSLGVRKQGFGTAGSEELIVDADADDGIDGASNVLSLTMQEATVDGNTGITYRITCLVCAWRR